MTGIQTWTPPVRAQRFLLDAVAGIGGLAALPGFEAATPETVDAILNESARFCTNVLVPLNRVGDEQGARLENGVVRLPDGFAGALRDFGAGGWTGLNAQPRHGGQGLPFVLACAVMEQVTSANMAFALAPMLTLGGIEALQAHGNARQQKLYLEPLIAGRWTATMNLTEPQAGSDVGAVRTRAEPVADGSWRIKGQKIFITWGDHEAAENIVHLVLARTPDAPAGTRGISLFIVPKYLVDAEGNPAERNDIRAVAIEHKLGIHGSPTCVMSFGDSDSCTGYLVGAENAGMQAMFTMMNHARINVGIQGVAIAERALQHATGYARTRIQSARFGGPREAVPIIRHQDVRRMLMTGRALTDAARAIAFLNAAAVDRAHALADADAQGLADLLTPVTKAFATDVGVEVSSLSLQVFGGMGYIEETGAAQFYRDARIAPIYEGTNGIQALDLVGRKLRADGGKHWRELLMRERAFVAGLKQGALSALHPYLDDALEALQAASVWIADAHNPPDDVAAGATPYLRMFGLTLGGLLLARQAGAAAHAEGDADFLGERIAVARYFAEQILPQAPALLGPITRGAGDWPLQAPDR
ncbi:MAG: acyl-CoA dehydrogenase [Sphingomonadaceae bacterium]